MLQPNNQVQWLSEANFNTMHIGGERERASERAKDTNDKNRQQDQSKVSGERKLLRNSRAVLDVFRFDGRE